MPTSSLTLGIVAENPQPKCEALREAFSETEINKNDELNRRGFEAKSPAAVNRRNALIKKFTFLRWTFDYKL